MGRELHEADPRARETWREAEQALGFPLRQVAFEGPKDELDDTLNAQPALLVSSIAAWRVRQANEPLNPAYLAGHSLGEYTALVAAGSLDLAQAVRLVRERGRLMKEAGQQRPGGMAALLGLEPAVVEDIAAQAGVAVANDNCPGQIVVSGSQESVARAIELARERGGKAIPLAVSIASHSPLMEPARDGLQRAVEASDIQEPQTPVVFNTTARPIQEPAEIARALVEQLTSAVRWRETLLYLAEQGCGSFVEVGPGKVLSGLVKRTLAEAHIQAFG